MDKFAALLNSEWYEGCTNTVTDQTSIIGSWGEDNSEYMIEVPSQLRPLIIELQNALYTKYQELKQAERKYEDSSNWFKSGGLI
jgi:hypothetical protein